MIDIAAAGNSYGNSQLHDIELGLKMEIVSVASNETARCDDPGKLFDTCLFHKNILQWVEKVDHQLQRVS